MNKAITPGVKAKPLHWKIIFTIVTLFALLFSSTFTQCARANTQLIEDPDVGAQLCTPVYEWLDPSVASHAVVLCLHGFSAHGTAYNGLAQELTQQGLLVYAIDFRGFGKTYAQGSDRRVSYNTFADSDVTAIARCLNTKYPEMKLFVCGESMGAALALRLAARNPELVDGIIISAPSLQLKKHIAFIAKCLTSLVIRRGIVDLSHQLVVYGSSDPSVGLQLVRDPLVRKHYTVRELIQCVWMTADTRRFIPAVPSQTPVLVLQSFDDKTVNPLVIKMLRRRLKTTDLTVLAFSNKGHVILEVQQPPADTTRPINDWLYAHLR